MTVHEGRTARGTAIHTTEADAPQHVLDHRHLKAVTDAVQRALDGQAAPGVTAGVAVSRAEAASRMKEGGMRPEQMTNVLRDTVLAQWLENATKRNRIELQVRELLVEGGDHVVLKVNGVVFTDEQFGAFLSKVVEEVLAAFDTITDDGKVPAKNLGDVDAVIRAAISNERNQ